MSDATRAVLADLEHNGANSGGGLPEVGRWVQQADVYAYELVRHVGGVYVNCDIEPLQDLGPALEGLDGFVVAECAAFMSNAVMGAVAGHPLFVDLSETLPARFAGRRSCTGFMYWRREGLAACGPLCPRSGCPEYRRRHRRA